MGGLEVTRNNAFRLPVVSAFQADLQGRLFMLGDWYCTHPGGSGLTAAGAERGDADWLATAFEREGNAAERTGTEQASWATSPVADPWCEPAGCLHQVLHIVYMCAAGVELVRSAASLVGLDARLAWWHTVLEQVQRRAPDICSAPTTLARIHALTFVWPTKPPSIERANLTHSLAVRAVYGGWETQFGRTRAPRCECYVWPPRGMRLAALRCLFWSDRRVVGFRIHRQLCGWSCLIFVAL